MDKLDILTPSKLKQQFVIKLDRLCKQQQTGSYILALANALSDPQLYPLLAAQLQNTLQQLKKKLPESSKDDLHVFYQLLAAENSFPEVASRQALGAWLLQHNPMRAFRPARNAQKVINSIYQPFDPNGFHFNKPFLQKEQFAEILFQHTNIRLFFNKFPFSEYHLLLLLDAHKNQPQLLNAQTLATMHQLAIYLSQHAPYQYLGYNSIGAFASVNHLHFHFTSLEQALPVFDSRWQHNGGKEAYPLPCQKFDSAQTAWQAIEQLHQQDLAYNLVLNADSILLMVRSFQGSYQSADWLPNAAWFELSGVFTLAEKNICNTLDEKQLYKELQKASNRQTG